MVFTSKGLIVKQYCGYTDPMWCLLEHNTHVWLKTYDSLQDCLGDVYSPLIEYHRPPTKAEISFGHGATHHRSFAPIDCVKPTGELKKWFVSSDDGLRYYR